VKENLIEAAIYHHFVAGMAATHWKAHLEKMWRNINILLYMMPLELRRDEAETLTEKETRRLVLPLRIKYVDLRHSNLPQDPLLNSSGNKDT
jgi:hypothetical protein